MYPGGKNNMKDLLKQAQKMQQDLMKAQEDLKTREVETSSGGGMVTVKMDGSYHINSIKLDPAAVDPTDVEMLEDLIMAALHEAHQKVESNTNDEMSKLTGGMKLPGLF